MYNKQPGYPLPSGELGDDEIVCQLVYLPDRDEYWQALLGGLHYFTTWLAWERDDDKRGKDAAANWRQAFEKTMECWRMTCLEDLEQTVSDILTLLQNKKDCCDDSISYQPTIEVETDIEPGIGDPPDYYGETAITTWEEWNDHVCYYANAYVDNLIYTSSELQIAVQNSTIFLGLVSALLVLLAFTGIGLPVAYGLAMAITSGLILGATTLTFDDTAENLEDGREDIVCAFILGTSVADAVEAALGSAADWDLFYSMIPYETAQAIIYEGGYNGEYLGDESLDTCECEWGASGIYITNDGSYVSRFSKDQGSTWHNIAGQEIELGVEYWFDNPSSGDPIFVLYTTPGVIKRNLRVVDIEVMLPAGNGCYVTLAEWTGSTWAYHKNNVLMISPGDWPVSYDACCYYAFTGNSIMYSLGYYVKMTFYPEVT